MNKLLLGIFIVLLGLAMGSFSACMGYRIPNKISTYKKRSFCPKCKKQLKWYMNIPLFSYVLLNGKCAYCGEKISIIYPAIEFVSCELVEDIETVHRWDRQQVDSTQANVDA